MANYDTYNRYGWDNFKALFSNYKYDANCCVTCTTCDPPYPEGCCCSPNCACETNCVLALGFQIDSDTDYNTYIISENGSIGWPNPATGSDYSLRFKGYIHKTNYSDGSSGIGMLVTDENSTMTYNGDIWLRLVMYHVL